jgi:hypothetical protein
MNSAFKPQAHSTSHFFGLEVREEGIRVLWQAILEKNHEMMEMNK